MTFHQSIIFSENLTFSDHKPALFRLKVASHAASRKAFIVVGLCVCLPSVSQTADIVALSVSFKYGKCGGGSGQCIGLTIVIVVF